jgi:hypothetical protein
MFKGSELQFMILARGDYIAKFASETRGRCLWDI